MCIWVSLLLAIFNNIKDVFYLEKYNNKKTNYLIFNNNRYKQYLNLNILYYIKNLEYKVNNLYIAI